MIETRRNIFNMKINIKINLFENDLEGYNKSPVFYITIPLYSYLYSYIPEINNFFYNYVQKITKHEIWFEYKNIPLKWNIPIGVNLDILKIYNDNDNNELRDPLNIIIHYRNFPNNLLGILRNDKILFNTFTHSLKESKLIQFEDKDIYLTRFSTDDNIKLWKYIKDNDFNNYYSIIDKIDKDNIIHNYSIKFYFASSDYYITKKLKITEQYKQSLTIINLLNIFFPNLFDNNNTVLKEEYKSLSIRSQLIDIDLNMLFDEIYNLFVNIDSSLYLIINI